MATIELSKLKHLIEVVHQVQCEGYRCFKVHQESELSYLPRNLSKLGWAIRDGQLLCPECQEEEE